MPVTTLLILLACLLIAAKFAGWLCQRIHMPAVSGQLLVGVVAGPSLLGLVHTESILDAFSTIGVILLMFIAGLETDMKQMREVGKAAFTSASLGVVLPFVAGTAFVTLLGYNIAASFFLAPCSLPQVSVSLLRRSRIWVN